MPRVLPHAQDAQGAAVHVRAQHGLERPLIPLPGAQPALGFGDPPRGGHQQGKAQIGRGFSQHVRRVAGQDAGSTERLDIQVVVAHADVGDGLQPVRASDLRRTDAFVEGDERAVHIGQLLRQRVRRPRGDLVRGLQVHPRAQRFDHRIDQRLAHPHPRPQRLSHRACRECAG